MARMGDSGAFTGGRSEQTPSESPGFISRFLKPRQTSESFEDRYKGNSNLLLKPDSLGKRNIGLEGLIGKLDDRNDVLINRSSSGSSQGSGKAARSNSSSGYGSEKLSRHLPEVGHLDVEFESEEDEGDGQTVVNGALRLTNSSHLTEQNQINSTKPIHTSKTYDSSNSRQQADYSNHKLMSNNSKMPDGLTNSISGFLQRTDHVNQELKNARREHSVSLNRDFSDLTYGSSPYGGDIRSSSVARSTSVARQFEPSPLASFTRAGSVSRGYDLSARDPYYSSISRASLSRTHRESSVPTNGLNHRENPGPMRGLGPLYENRALDSYRESSVPTNGLNHRDNLGSRPIRGLGPLYENRTLDALQSSADITHRSRLINFSKNDLPQPANSRFRNLEDECNWILSGRDPLPENKHERLDDDENTLDDISGDEGFKSCFNSLRSSRKSSTTVLSEMTADLTEEQNASTLATERLETEQAERMRLEREKAELVTRNKNLSTNTDRLELEVLASRSLDYSCLEVGDSNDIYRSKYERAMKDLDHMKKLLGQQHEDDLDTLMATKKQLEKKLHDAYEEVEDQRQVVVQWKRKTQKIQGEMNDTRLLLEEQTSRNDLLEKKQRKFDTELAMVQDDRRQEEMAREKVQRELENIRTKEARAQDQIQAMKQDAESKDEKIHALQKEIIEMQGGGATEEEVRSLKKGKKDLEMQLKDQEEELDDLAAQVQMLEGSRTKLEMEMAAIKKEFRRELTNKDEEIEEARASANKKVKILEQQLEQEHEERIMFLRERHDLEQKIGTLQDMLERSGDEEQVAKLKKDLKKTKALLRDAQLLVEKNQNDGTNKVILRQLKNQLEDAEFARTAAMKARQNAELELADTHSQLDEVSRGKQDLEDRYLRTSREKAELSSQLQENEEELQDVMRKYKASVAAVSTDQITIQDQQETIQELENDRNKLRDSVAELASKLGNLEGENVSTSQHKRLELKIREFESKLELEITSKSRMEIQIQRLKEVVDKLTKEKEEVRVREAAAQELAKKTNRQLRDVKEEFTTIQGKETELCQKKFDLEKQLEVAEAETLTVRSDLKLALKRIEDLQAAIQGDIDTDNSDDNSDSDGEMHSFLEHHRRAMSVQRERESMARESVVRESMGRDSTSMVRESMTREIRTNGARTYTSLEESRETTSLDSSKNSTILEADESQA